MIKGIGTDILEISRFKKVMDKHPERFLKRIFNLDEQKYCQTYIGPISHLAARFSVKEAIAKALGSGIGQNLSFKDMIIERETNGKPTVRFSEKAQEKFQNPKVEISISHCQKYVTATAIWF